MRRRSLASWVLVASFASFAGCGGDASPAKTYADFVDDLARAECAGLIRCTEFVSPLVVGDLFLTVRGLGDADRCAEVLRDELVAPAERAAIEEAIEEGRIVFDGAAASACNEAISTDVCVVEAFGLASILAAIDESCAAVLVGAVEDGGSCFLDEECAPGLTCDTFPGTCGGTCEPVDALEHQVELGGVCASAEDCVYGAICDGTCKLLSIVADHEVGEPCILEVADATTRTFHTCETGLGCAAGEVEPTCVELLAAGADCTANTAVPCVAGHACLPDPEPATTHSCRAMHVATGVGADCTDFLVYTGGDVTFCDATLDLYCGSSATCVAAGDGSAGSTCAVEGGGAQYRAPCDPGLYCEDDVTNECTAKKAADAPCTADEECLSDLCLGDLCAASYCDTTDLVF